MSVKQSQGLRDRQSRQRLSRKDVDGGDHAPHDMAGEQGVEGLSAPRELEMPNEVLRSALRFLLARGDLRMGTR